MLKKNCRKINLYYSSTKTLNAINYFSVLRIELKILNEFK